MIEAFIRHIEEKALLSKQKTYLLACSGGLDSMTLANLLTKAEIPFQIAHVNFQLRGEESDHDEVFLKEFARNTGLTIHVSKAETQAYVQNHKVSIQEAARELRYAFFEKVRIENKLDGIVVAHHQDDQLETIFINLVRGTGIEGIAGMSDKRGHIIRPLLPFSRAEIQHYGEAQNLQWREDSSNAKTDYLRNKLRHEMLPKLLDIKPDARKNLLSSLERVKDTNRAFSGLYEEWKKRYNKLTNEIWSLEIKGLKHYSGSQSLLFYWLRPFGFNSDQSKNIHLAASTQNSGKIFESGEYLANVDRDQILVCKKEETFQPIQLLNSDIQLSLGDETYSILQSNPDDFLDRNPENAMLDFDLLTFPLEVRNWEQGDRFNPLGMRQEKKVSDFLIDIKVPFIKKAQVKVVLSAGKIVWVIGHRIADWAKKTSGTRKILYFKKI